MLLVYPAVLENRVKQENKEKTDNLVQWVNVDLLVKLDFQENRVLLELLVKKGHKELMDYPEAKDLRGNEEKLGGQDNQVTPGLLVNLVLVAQKDNRETPETKDCLEKTARTASRDQMVHLAVRVHRAFQDQRDKMEPQEILDVEEHVDRREPAVHQVQPVLRELVDKWDQLDRVGPLELKENLEKKVSKEKLELSETKDRQAAWVIKGFKEKKEILDHQALQEIEEVPEQPDNLEPAVHLAPRDQKVVLDNLAFLVLRVPVE